MLLQRRPSTRFRLPWDRVLSVTRFARYNEHALACSWTIDDLRRLRDLLEQVKARVATRLAATSVFLRIQFSMSGR